MELLRCAIIPHELCRDCENRINERLWRRWRPGCADEEHLRRDRCGGGAGRRGAIWSAWSRSLVSARSWSFRREIGLRAVSFARPGFAIDGEVVRGVSDRLPGMTAWVSACFALSAGVALPAGCLSFDWNGRVSSRLQDKGGRQAISRGSSRTICAGVKNGAFLWPRGRRAFPRGGVTVVLACVGCGQQLLGCASSERVAPDRADRRARPRGWLEPPPQ